MEIVFPDYNNCLTNVTNSILKYYECMTYHNSLEVLDRYLNSREFKNVVLILYDGMGSSILKRNLDKDAFLNQNKVKDICAVFPPTTVASTTSVLTGLNPCEHGWLGWDMYYKEEDKIVSMFTNTIKDTEMQASSENLANKYYPYASIIDLLKSKVNSSYVSPYGGINYQDLADMHSKIKEICNSDGKQFIYAYYEEPDHSMHELGTDHEEVIKIFRNINEKTEKLCNSLRDTLVIVVADHGHKNASKILLSEYPDIMEMLVRDTTIEGRACSFYVKEEKREEFVKLFNSYFSEDFLLFSHDEVIAKKMFGTGYEHMRFIDSFGDFIAIAKGDKYFRTSNAKKDFLSTHAGLTEDEVFVPLIIWSSKE